MFDFDFDHQQDAVKRPTNAGQDFKSKYVSPM